MTRRRSVALGVALVLAAAAATTFVVFRHEAKATTGWSISFRTRAAAVSPLANPPVADFDPIAWTTAEPTMAAWRVTATIDANGYAAVAVNVRDSSGQLVDDLAPGVNVSIIDGQWHQVAVKAETASDGLHLTLTVDSVGATKIASHALAAAVHLTTPGGQLVNVGDYAVTDLQLTSV
jgi:hypothetical protein